MSVRCLGFFPRHLILVSRFAHFHVHPRATCITALQWAKTYENSNRRLAVWGTVFSAYGPHLSIVHRPGRKHSNVNPLSRLYWAPPPQDSPARDDSIALEMNPIHIDFSSNPSMGKAALAAFSIHNCLEVKEVFINTRSQGVCKKKSWYTRSFYLDKVSQTLPPPLHLPKKEISHVPSFLTRTCFYFHCHFRPEITLPPPF